MTDAVTTSIATVADIDELHEFMLSDFLHEQSLSAAINLTREQASPIYREFIEHCAPSGVTTIQRNSGGNVIGFNLCSLVRHGEEEDESDSSASVGPIGKLLGVLNANKWELIPKVGDKLLYVEVLSVDERYRGRGLAQKLLELSYERARLLGVSGAFAECTSIASQKERKKVDDPLMNNLLQLFAKTGYQVLREIRLHEFLGDDGKRVFVCPDGTNTAQLVFKNI